MTISLIFIILGIICFFIGNIFLGTILIVIGVMSFMFLSLSSNISKTMNLYKNKKSNSEDKTNKKLEVPTNIHKKIWEYIKKEKIGDAEQYVKLNEFYEKEKKAYLWLENNATDEIKYKMILKEYPPEKYGFQIIKQIYQK